MTDLSALWARICEAANKRTVYRVFERDGRWECGPCAYSDVLRPDGWYEDQAQAQSAVKELNELNARVRWAVNHDGLRLFLQLITNPEKDSVTFGTEAEATEALKSAQKSFARAGGALLDLLLKHPGSEDHVMDYLDELIARDGVGDDEYEDDDDDELWFFEAGHGEANG